MKYMWIAYMDNMDRFFSNLWIAHGVCLDRFCDLSYKRSRTSIYRLLFILFVTEFETDTEVLPVFPCTVNVVISI